MAGLCIQKQFCCLLQGTVFDIWLSHFLSQHFLQVHSACIYDHLCTDVVNGPCPPDRSAALLATPLQERKTTPASAAGSLNQT